MCVRVTRAFQRVARHLLDLAAEGGPELVAPVSQQQLADAVGTVREVVVRVLRDLRRAGVIRTGRDRIVIVDPARLSAEQDWNSSS
jgi:CRP/FNR family cyclic AMP-dependent transcriptional regulator